MKLLSILIIVLFITGYAEARMSKAMKYNRSHSYSKASQHIIKSDEKRTRERNKPDEIHIGPTPRLNILERLKYVEEQIEEILQDEQNNDFD